jgi:hypothetical protein
LSGFFPLPLSFVGLVTIVVSIFRPRLVSDIENQAKISLAAVFMKFGESQSFNGQHINGHKFSSTLYGFG